MIIASFIIDIWLIADKIKRKENIEGNNMNKEEFQSRLEKIESFIETY